MRCIWENGPSSWSSPSHAMPSMITSTAAWLERSRSVSSMRRMKSPPVARANAQGYGAERMLPRWINPVGDGAKRGRTRPAPEAVVSVMSISSGPRGASFKIQSIQRAGAKLAARSPSRTRRPATILCLNLLGIRQRQAGGVFLSLLHPHPPLVQAGDALGGNVSGHINTIKAGRIKPYDGAIEGAHRLFHAVHILINQCVAANRLANLFHGAAMGHQFAAGGHVNTVHVGVTHRRCSAGKVHLARAGIACHLHDLAAGGATHDGIVHQQHIAALELAADHIELLAHRLLAHTLPRHDEGPAHIAVLDKAFAVWDAQQVSQLRGTGAAGLGDRDDHVDFVGWHGRHHALGKGL